MKTPAPICLLFLLASCAQSPPAPPSAAADPVAGFLAALQPYCGQAFAGRIVANEPAVPNDPFAGKPILMHVRECSDGRIAIPLHVGADRSRTWVLSRSADGLKLQHDHRHADGSPDRVTLYGGTASAAGSASRQEFPADDYSKELFGAAGLAVSVNNTWAMEIGPGSRFAYELSRPGRLFRLEFDLAVPQPQPPDPWGHPPLPAQ